MNNRTLCFSLFTTFVFQLYGQNESSNAYKIGGFYLQGGSGSSVMPQLSSTVFSALSPEWSKIRDSRYTNLEWSNSGSTYQEGLSAGLIVQPKNLKSDWLNSHLSFYTGFSYMFAGLFHRSVDASGYFTYDTLFDFNGKPDFLKDSIFRRFQGINYHSHQLLLDATVVLRSSQKRRISFFAGLGLSAGYSISTRTAYYQSENSGSSTRAVNEEPKLGTVQTWYIDKYVVSKNKNFFAWTVQLPLGIDFRLSDKHKFFSKTHVYAEWKAMVNFRYAVETGTLIYPGSMRALGLRVRM
jgi:hypothetical protein